MKYIWLFLIVGTFSTSMVSSCKQLPDYSDVPQIEFVGFNKATLLQGKLNEDTILLTISFQDGDGDLGDNNSLDIVIKDTRIDNAQPLKYAIPNIPEQGRENGLSGEMTIKLFSTCCFQGSIACEPFEDMPEDQLVYSVMIRDLAGNESNTILTEPIRLLCR